MMSRPTIQTAERVSRILQAVSTYETLPHKNALPTVTRALDLALELLHDDMTSPDAVDAVASALDCLIVAIERDNETCGLSHLSIRLRLYTIRADVLGTVCRVLMVTDNDALDQKQSSKPAVAVKVGAPTGLPAVTDELSLLERDDVIMAALPHALKVPGMALLSARGCLNHGLSRVAALRAALECDTLTAEVDAITSDARNTMLVHRFRYDSMLAPRAAIQDALPRMFPSPRDDAGESTGLCVSGCADASKLRVRAVLNALRPPMQVSARNSCLTAGATLGEGPFAKAEQARLDALFRALSDELRQIAAVGYDLVQAYGAHARASIQRCWQDATPHLSLPSADYGGFHEALDRALTYPRGADGEDASTARATWAAFEAAPQASSLRLDNHVAALQAAYTHGRWDVFGALLHLAEARLACSGPPDTGACARSRVVALLRRMREVEAVPIPGPAREAPREQLSGTPAATTAPSAGAGKAKGSEGLKGKLAAPQPVPALDPVMASAEAQPSLSLSAVLGLQPEARESRDLALSAACYEAARLAEAIAAEPRSGSREYDRHVHLLVEDAVHILSKRLEAVWESRRGVEHVPTIASTASADPANAALLKECYAHLLAASDATPLVDAHFHCTLALRLSQLLSHPDAGEAALGRARASLQSGLKAVQSHRDRQTSYKLRCAALCITAAEAAAGSAPADERALVTSLSGSVTLPPPDEASQAEFSSHASAAVLHVNLLRAWMGVELRASTLRARGAAVAAARAHWAEADKRAALEARWKPPATAAQRALSEATAAAPRDSEETLLLRDAQAAQGPGLLGFVPRPQDEAAVLQACGRNAAWRALALMAAVPHRHSAAGRLEALTAASEQLERAQRQEAAYAAACSASPRPAGVGQAACVPVPVVLGRTSTSITIAAPPGLPPSKAGPLVLLGKPYGSGTEVTASSCAIPGTGNRLDAAPWRLFTAPIPDEVTCLPVGVTIEGLAPAEAYAFAFATDERLDKHTDVSASTAPVVTATPLPLHLLWSHLASLAAEAGEWAVARRAALQTATPYVRPAELTLASLLDPHSRETGSLYIIDLLTLQRQPPVCRSAVATCLLIVADTHAAGLGMSEAVTRNHTVLEAVPAVMQRWILQACRTATLEAAVTVAMTGGDGGLVQEAARRCLTAATSQLTAAQTSLRGGAFAARARSAVSVCLQALISLDVSTLQESTVASVAQTGRALLGSSARSSNAEEALSAVLLAPPPSNSGTQQHQHGAPLAAIVSLLDALLWGSHNFPVTEAAITSLAKAADAPDVASALLTAAAPDAPSALQASGAEGDPALSAALRLTGLITAQRYANSISVAVLVSSARLRMQVRTDPLAALSDLVAQHAWVGPHVAEPAPPAAKGTAAGVGAASGAKSGKGAAATPGAKGAVAAASAAAPVPPVDEGAPNSTFAYLAHRTLSTLLASASPAASPAAFARALVTPPAARLTLLLDSASGALGRLQRWAASATLNPALAEAVQALLKPTVAIVPVKAGSSMYDIAAWLASLLLPLMCVSAVVRAPPAARLALNSLLSLMQGVPAHDEHEESVEACDADAEEHARMALVTSGGRARSGSISGLGTSLRRMSTASRAGSVVAVTTGFRPGSSDEATGALHIAAQTRERIEPASARPLWPRALPLDPAASVGGADGTACLLLDMSAIHSLTARASCAALAAQLSMAAADPPPTSDVLTSHVTRHGAHILAWADRWQLSSETRIPSGVLVLAPATPAYLLVQPSDVTVTNSASCEPGAAILESSARAAVAARLAGEWVALAASIRPLLGVFESATLTAAHFGPQGLPQSEPSTPHSLPLPLPQASWDAVTPPVLVVSSTAAASPAMLDWGHMWRIGLAACDALRALLRLSGGDNDTHGLGAGADDDDDARSQDDLLSPAPNGRAGTRAAATTARRGSQASSVFTKPQSGTPGVTATGKLATALCARGPGTRTGDPEPPYALVPWPDDDNEAQQECNGSSTLLRSDVSVAELLTLCRAVNLAVQALLHAQAWHEAASLGRRFAAVAPSLLDCLRSIGGVGADCDIPWVVPDEAELPTLAGSAASDDQVTALGPSQLGGSLERAMQDERLCELSSHPQDQSHPTCSSVSDSVHATLRLCLYGARVSWTAARADCRLARGQLQSTLLAFASRPSLREEARQSYRALSEYEAALASEERRFCVTRAVLEARMDRWEGVVSTRLAAAAHLLVAAARAEDARSEAEAAVAATIIPLARHCFGDGTGLPPATQALFPVDALGDQLTVGGAVVAGSGKPIRTWRDSAASRKAAKMTAAAPASRPLAPMADVPQSPAEIALSALKAAIPPLRKSRHTPLLTQTLCLLAAAREQSSSAAALQHYMSALDACFGRNDVLRSWRAILSTACPAAIVDGLRPERPGRPQLSAARQTASADQQAPVVARAPVADRLAEALGPDGCLAAAVIAHHVARLSHALALTGSAVVSPCTGSGSGLPASNVLELRLLSATCLASLSRAPGYRTGNTLPDWLARDAAAAVSSTIGALRSHGDAFAPVALPLADLYSQLVAGSRDVPRMLDAVVSRGHVCAAAGAVDGAFKALAEAMGIIRQEHERRAAVSAATTQAAPVVEPPKAATGAKVSTTSGAAAKDKLKGSPAPASAPVPASTSTAAGFPAVHIPNPRLPQTHPTNRAACEWLASASLDEALAPLAAGRAASCDAMQVGLADTVLLRAQLCVRLAACSRFAPEYAGSPPLRSLCNSASSDAPLADAQPPQPEALLAAAQRALGSLLSVPSSGLKQREAHNACALFLAQVHRLRGDYGAAAHALSSSLDQPGASPASELRVLHDLALTHVLSGDTHAAASSLDRGLALAGQAGDTLWRGRLLRLKAQAAFADGEAEVAYACARDAVMAQAGEAPSCATPALQLQPETAAAMGPYDALGLAESLTLCVRIHASLRGTRGSGPALALPQSPGSPGLPVSLLCRAEGLLQHQAACAQAALSGAAPGALGAALHADLLNALAEVRLAISVAETDTGAGAKAATSALACTQPIAFLAVPPALQLHTLLRASAALRDAGDLQQSQLHAEDACRLATHLLNSDPSQMPAVQGALTQLLLTRQALAVASPPDVAPVLRLLEAMRASARVGLVIDRFRAAGGFRGIAATECATRDALAAPSNPVLPAVTTTKPPKGAAPSGAATAPATQPSPVLSQLPAHLASPLEREAGAGASPSQKLCVLAGLLDGWCLTRDRAAEVHSGGELCAAASESTRALAAALTFAVPQCASRWEVPRAALTGAIATAAPEGDRVTAYGSLQNGGVVILRGDPAGWPPAYSGLAVSALVPERDDPGRARLLIAFAPPTEPKAVQPSVTAGAAAAKPDQPTKKVAAPASVPATPAEPAPIDPASQPLLLLIADTPVSTAALAGVTAALHRAAADLRSAVCPEAVAAIRDRITQAEAGAALVSVTASDVSPAPEKKGAKPAVTSKSTAAAGAAPGKGKQAAAAVEPAAPDPVAEEISAVVAAAQSRLVEALSSLSCLLQPTDPGGNSADACIRDALHRAITASEAPPPASLAEAPTGKASAAGAASTGKVAAATKGGPTPSSGQAVSLTTTSGYETDEGLARGEAGGTASSSPLDTLRLRALFAASLAESAARLFLPRADAHERGSDNAAGSITGASTPEPGKHVAVRAVAIRDARLAAVLSSPFPLPHDSDPRKFLLRDV